MPPAQRDEGAAPAALVVTLGAAAALALALGRWGGDLADLLLDASRLLLEPAALVSDRHARALGALRALPDGSRGLEFAWAVFGAASRPWAWGLGLPLIALLMWRGRRVSVRDVHRRTLDMRRLAAETASWAPCAAPALSWPGGILNEPLDAGPWRAGRQPLQLACEQGLLVTPESPPRPVAASEVLGPNHLPRADSPWAGLERGGLALDRERAARCCAAQLRGRWEGWEALPPYLRKLSAAWALFAAGEKKEAQALLDACSLSFRGPEPARGPSLSWRPPFLRPGRPARGYVMDTGLDAATRRRVREALAEEGVARAMAAHGVWRDLCLLGLYEKARTRGVLPTAEFLWLRPVNRPLYYLCNNVGRRTAWPEIAGAWAHYQAEAALARLDPDSRGIMEPRVMEAVDALETALYEEGWISPDRLSPEAAAALDPAAGLARGG